MQIHARLMLALFSSCTCGPRTPTSELSSVSDPWSSSRASRASSRSRGYPRGMGDFSSPLFSPSLPFMHEKQGFLGIPEDTSAKGKLQAGHARRYLSLFARPAPFWFNFFASLPAKARPTSPACIFFTFYSKKPPCPHGGRVPSCRSVAPSQSRSRRVPGFVDSGERGAMGGEGVGVVWWGKG
jgi:hypothetical protein